MVNNFKRRKTKVVRIGKVAIGGNNPIAVQSMTKTFTHDVAATVKQILELEHAGCNIIRLAIPDLSAAEALRKIKAKIHIPLVADIHFDHRLALLSIENGADKIRINPGNIGSEDKIRSVVSACKERKIPIRVGVNSGSVEKRLLSRRHAADPEKRAAVLVESALDNVRILEKMGFFNIVIAVKSTSVQETIAAYRKISGLVSYPLHLGVTEAGVPPLGEIRSAVGIGTLLSEGIGDTLRVSLTAPPIEEVRAGCEILKSLALGGFGVTIVSCPTCGRCGIDLSKVARAVQAEVTGIKKPLKIAIMGCAVNGPGEAKEADLGIAGGKGMGLLFKKGKIIARVPEKDLVKALIREIKKA